MKFENSGGVNIVKTPLKVVLSTQVSSIFPLYLYIRSVDNGNGTSVETKKSMSLKREVFTVMPDDSFFSSLDTSQEGQGFRYVKNLKGKKLVTSGLCSNQQTYIYC